jgi:hypothetical protein
MPTTPPPTNPDGSLRPLNPAEVAALGVQWKGVRDGSTPTLSFGINDNRAEASCFINPAYYDLACYYFLGTSKTYEVTEGETTRTKLSRLLPFRLPGRGGLVVTKVPSMTGFKFTGKQAGVTSAGGWVNYEKVELKLLFETPKYRLREDGEEFECDRYVEVDPGTATSETIATFGSNLRFRRNPALPEPAVLPDGIPIPTNSVNKVQPKDQFITTMWRVPEDMADDSSDWLAKVYGTGAQNSVGLVGCVNSVTLHGRPPGTLLLKGVRRLLDVSPLGDGTFEYRLEFTWETLPSGWLNLWFASPAFPGTNGYYQVTTGSYKNPGTEVVLDGTCLYNVRDLRQAYQPGPYPP